MIARYCPLRIVSDAQAPVDFLLCIGDDDDDEYMLSAAAARSCAPSLRERMAGKLFTVSVGSRATSHAHFFAPDASQVQRARCSPSQLDIQDGCMRPTQVLALLESLKQSSPVSK